MGACFRTALVHRSSAALRAMHTDTQLLTSWGGAVIILECQYVHETSLQDKLEWDHGPRTGISGLLVAVLPLFSDDLGETAVRLVCVCGVGCG